MKIINTSITILTILITLFLIMSTISKKTKMMRNKNSPFECGFTKKSSTRKSFSIQFFLIATIFLIFDMEISMIMPMYSTKMINPAEWMMSSSLTMIILIMGLINEWKMGMLEWSK
uniref:NADH dehydrogenase subunit 3 n=1 Tax=Zanna robusticephalica TaxID=3081104 RepID=UPI002A80A753|nr:NADH dehydrogenase subunit 3 [Zanna robusticephalica]WOW98859.1 NADH dehydrogenase subunit 3 [Zanna robusticephalica]